MLYSTEGEKGNEKLEDDSYDEDRGLLFTGTFFLNFVKDILICFIYTVQVFRCVCVCVCTGGGMRACVCVCACVRTCVRGFARNRPIINIVQ